MGGKDYHSTELLLLMPRKNEVEVLKILFFGLITQRPK